jgi:hypothetical protein
MGIIPLITENIGNFVIYNSIESFAPTIVMRYLDSEFELSHILNNNKFYLHFSLQSEQLDREGKNPVNISDIFIINNVKIIYQRESGILYEFSGVQRNDLFLSLNVNVTHDKAELVSPYDMITAALSKAELMFDPDYTNTDKRISFISPQSWSVKDIVNYCLEVAVTKKTPPSYFFTRLHDKTCMLWNQFTKSKIAQNVWNRTLKVVTKNISVDHNPNKNEIISDIQTNVALGGSDNLRLLSTRVFNHFNHDKREWTQTIYSNKDMIGLVELIKNNPKTQYKDVFLNIDEIGYKIFKNELRQDYPSWHEHKIYNILRNLEICSENIQFKVAGQLSRDCGQALLLSVTDESLKNKFDGIWVIYSCAHIFDGSSYYNEIVCYRTMNKNFYI